MIDWLERLNNAWIELLSATPVARQFRTKLVSAEVPLDILAAVRAIDNAPCLILQTTLEPKALFELGGMRLQLVPDDSGPLLVLSLEDERRRDLFSTICADVVGCTANAAGAKALSQFTARIDAWRLFLRDRRSGLTRSDTVGLIGELVVLCRLLSVDPKLILTWQAPRDGLHDFYSDGHALEVKSTLGPASSLIISKLDQLDTVGLRRLDLLYVRLLETPTGHSLQDLVENVLEILPDEGSRDEFRNALLRRGLMPQDTEALSSPKIELRSIDAYSVNELFPRLVRSTLPVAITEAVYTLEIRALEQFSADTRIVIDSFAQRIGDD